MKEETKKDDALVVSVDGVEGEVEKVIDQTLKEIQQRIGGTKVLKEYAKRIGAEVGATANLAKEIQNPESPEALKLKGKIKGLEHAVNVVAEVIGANDSERLRAEGRLTAYREVVRNIEAKREAAKTNAERLKGRGEGEGFREDGAPDQIKRDKKSSKKQGKKKATRKKKPAKKAGKGKRS